VLIFTPPVTRDIDEEFVPPFLFFWISTCLAFVLQRPVRGAHRKFFFSPPLRISDLTLRRFCQSLRMKTGPLQVSRMAEEDAQPDLLSLFFSLSFLQRTRSSFLAPSFCSELRLGVSSGGFVTESVKLRVRAPPIRSQVGDDSSYGELVRSLPLRTAVCARAHLSIPSH